MKNKKYLILGSNNFWYGICDTKKEVAETIKDIKLDPTDYEDPESGYQPDAPSELTIYQAQEIDTIELDDEVDE